jgi:hypothetical protein
MVDLNDRETRETEDGTVQVRCRHDGCGGYYSTRGIGPHEDHCDHAPDADPGPDPEPDPGADADAEPEPEPEPDDDPETVTCPTCGNRDGGRGKPIMLADPTAERRLVDDGPLGPEAREPIRRNDYLCMACASAFGGGE